MVIFHGYVSLPEGMTHILRSISLAHEKPMGFLSGTDLSDWWMSIFLGTKHCFFVDDPFSFSLPTMNKNDKTSSLAWNYFLPVMHYFLIFFVASLAKYQWDTQVVGEHGEKTRKKCPIYIYPPKKIEKRNILKSDGWFFYGFLGLLRVAIHLLPRFWGSSEAAPKTDTQTLLWVLGDGPSGPSTRRRVGNHQADWHSHDHRIGWWENFHRKALEIWW